MEWLFRATMQQWMRFGYFPLRLKSAEFFSKANGTAPWTPFWEIRIRPFIITSLGFRLVHHVQGLHSAAPASNLRPKASAVWLFGRCHILCVKWWRSKGNSYLLDGILFPTLPFKAWDRAKEKSTLEKKTPQLIQTFSNRTRLLFYTRLSITYPDFS